MPRYILDAFALMAFFQAEPGGRHVREILEAARDGNSELYMTVVNLGEVVYTLERRRGWEAARDGLGFVDQSPIRLVEVDRPLALQAARLKASTGMGYLDCFVAGLAQYLEATVITGDPGFDDIPGLTVEWLAQREPE